MLRLVCSGLLVVLLALACIEAVPVEQQMEPMGEMQQQYQQDGPMMAMMPMEDPMAMQEQQPLTLEDMVAVNEQGEMEMVREKRHHRYGGGYGGGFGGYRGGYGGFGGYGGYRGGYGGGFGGHRGGFGGYRRGGYW